MFDHQTTRDRLQEHGLPRMEVWMDACIAAPLTQVEAGRSPDGWRGQGASHFGATSKVQHISELDLENGRFLSPGPAALLRGSWLIFM